MTRLAQVVFGVLVLAAFGAFFAAQKLKSSPSVVQRFTLRWPVISPNHDGRNDAQRVRFRLKKADTVDVAVVDADGDEVKEIGSGRRMEAYQYPKPSFTWDGTDADGRPVPDGTYRIRITLRGQGRNVVIRQAFRVDRTPPTPRIVSIGPDAGTGPELLPHQDGAPARIRFNAPALHGRLLIFGTAPGRVRLVREIVLPDGATKTTWDGRGNDGRPVDPGPYLAVLEVRDKAGNIGRSASLGRNGLPIVPYGGTIPGHGGISVREIAVQPPLVPTTSGDRVAIGVDARGQPYDWSVRRVGGPVLRHSTATVPPVRLKAPGENSGVYLFETRRDDRTATTPLAVDDAASHRVLVVLPVMTWQGRNPVDDDGDGWPNLLGDGNAVKLRRVLGVPLPTGFAAREAPSLIWMDSERHRYDVTTDLALALSGGAKLLAAHSGVLLLGDEVWLPPLVQRRLRRFVTRGGTLASLGVASLRRQARLTPRLRLTDPTPPATTDLFGSTIAPVRTGDFDLTNAKDDIGLFQGTSGQFSGLTSIEETTSPGRAKLLSSAVDGDGRAVIVALRVGKGIVIRFGLPEMPGRLASDPDLRALMGRTWELLAR